MLNLDPAPVWTSFSDCIALRLRAVCVCVVVEGGGGSFKFYVPASKTIHAAVMNHFF